MSSESSGETPSSPSASLSWWTTLYVFMSGIFFGTVIAAMFFFWKSPLMAKFRALLDPPPPSSHPHPSPAGHQEQPMESKDSQAGQEETAPSHPLDSNIAQVGPSSQEDSTSTHPRDPNILPSIPPSPRHVFKYDVFLSFRGSDTRNTFVDHLYHHLISKGIFPFMNDEMLRVGETISAVVSEAIRASRSSIVVFSRDYAASTWCLEEMATIVECHQKLEQVVFPIFYHVAPSHVRNQRGVYEVAFNKHTQRFKEDPGKVDRWKRAMNFLGYLQGWETKDKPEYEIIENITQKVVKMLDHKFWRLADDLVGVLPRVEELEELLNLGEDTVRVLGICGMGGVGKTTIANVVYNRIFYHFEATCFIQNVNQINTEGDVGIVQKQILSQLLEEENLEISDPFKSAFIIRRLSRKKVLIVLDDVDEVEQLDKLDISPTFLGRGSRIILISRDEHVLKAYGADAIYRVSLLNDKDAHELFSREAFNGKIPDDKSFLELIPKILEYAQNLPLAIKVLGSFLRDKNAAQWKSVFKRNWSFPKIENILRISFDSLESIEKDMFLHIACFFDGEKVEYVERILDTCGFFSRIGIQVLQDKSLIIINDKKIHVHKMLQELARKIVRAESPRGPELRSRLWLYEDFEYVLMSESGTENVKAIVLNQKEDITKCDPLRIEGLSKLVDLQLLILYHNNFSGKLNYLSNNLRYLLWHGYPLSSLPSFEPYSRLVELNLPNSSIEQLWEGPKAFPYLERVDLSNSEYVKETPNFELCPNIKQLNFTGCTKLILIHPSIESLTKLEMLSLRDCPSLGEIPNSTFKKLESLVALDLSQHQDGESMKRKSSSPLSFKP